MVADAPNQPTESSPCKDASPSAPEIFDAINELARRLHQFESRTLRESGLTPTQFFVLSQLAIEDGRPLSELAELCSCARPTMTGIADTLERKDLIRRNPNPSDRRGALISLTDKGRALHASTTSLNEMFGSCCCELLPAGEMSELGLLLARLGEALPF
jgi:DNA-binding MarR family transcriptional regulator